MARGKATKKKGKDMKTIFVIVIVVLVLAFVLFMQYQKPVVEDEGELAQMLPGGGNGQWYGGDGGNGKPSSDSKLMPGTSSYNCPANILKYCKDKFACDAYAYACMFYCMANGWNCCMMDIWNATGGHVVTIGQVESGDPDIYKFCIFESQINYNQTLDPDDEPCCWEQNETEGTTPLVNRANECMDEYPNIGNIVCSTDLEDFGKITDVDRVFPFPKKQCGKLNDAFEEAGYLSVEFCPKKGVL